MDLISASVLMMASMLILGFVILRYLDDKREGNERIMASVFILGFFILRYLDDKKEEKE